MRYSVDVRYSECDMQQVVHNSVYLRWCDDLADTFTIYPSLTGSISEAARRLHVHV